MKFLIRVLQVVMVAVPIVIFGWLLWLDLVPTGQLEVRFDLQHLSPFINRILPDARALPPSKLPSGEWAQQIIDEPVYFTVEPPRHFDFLELELVWQNDGVPIVELGGLAGEEGSQYFLVPLQNLLIDESDWDRTEENGIVLLQRDRTYESIDSFVTSPPDRSKIATYHYQLTTPYLIPTYIPSSISRTVDVSLRGFHEFKTYIKDENLNLDFTYMDMNRDKEGDSINILITNEAGELVHQVSSLDDGNKTDDAVPSGLEHIHVLVPDLPEGVYKVELRVGRDIFWRTLTTTQQKIVFLNNVYLADEVGYMPEDREVRFWTEAKNLEFMTHHADGAQEVRVAGELVRIPNPYEEYSHEVLSDGVVEVYSPQGDLIVYSDGHIAFSAAQYFNPDPVRLNWNIDLDRLGVDYIIAEYESPELIDGWYHDTAEFDTSWLVKIEDAWKLTISVAGIKDLQEDVWVSEINAVLYRDPLTWQKAKQEVKELWYGLVH